MENTPPPDALFRASPFSLAAAATAAAGLPPVPYTHKILEVQRTAVDCLSIIISRAGPETTGMLLAHRVPAVLCACIRHGSAPDPRSPLGAPASAQPYQPRTPPPPSSSSENRALHPLALSCVRALACLVHPTGPQWAPIRQTPFLEASGERGVGSPTSATVAAAAAALAVSGGLAIDMRAAVDLGSSVWRETATHLLRIGGGSAGGGGGGSGGGGGGGDDDKGGVDPGTTATLEKGNKRDGSGVSSGGGGGRRLPLLSAVRCLRSAG